MVVQSLMPMPSRWTGDATGLSCWSHLSSYVVCLLIVHAVICDLHGMLLVTGTGLDVGPARQWAVVLHPAWVLPEWHLPSHSAQPGSCQDSPGSFNIGVDAKGRSCTRQRRGHPCQLDGMVGTHASTTVHYLILPVLPMNPCARCATSNG